MCDRPPELRPDLSALSQTEPFGWVGFIVWLMLSNLAFWYLGYGQYM